MDDNEAKTMALTADKHNGYNDAYMYMIATMNEWFYDHHYTVWF